MNTKDISENSAHQPEDDKQDMPEMAATRNESSNNATHGACAGATQHSAGVSPVVQILNNNQKEVPSARNGEQLLQQTFVDNAGSDSIEMNTKDNSENSAHQPEDDKQDLPEMASTRNESSNNDTHGACAGATQHSAGVNPVVQIRVDIPELDPQNDYCVLPHGMFYDVTQRDDNDKYRCILCQCQVPPKDYPQHCTGKKHRRKDSYIGSRVHDSVNSLQTLLSDSYKRELQLFTSQNISKMPKGLQSLITCGDNAISAGFVIDNGYLVCLSLVTKKVCLNIDRTILRQANIMRNMVEFRKVFEGSCIVGGGNMWELMLVLHHHYGILSNAVADIHEFGTDDSGEEITLSNPKLHFDCATQAVECYDVVDASKTKLLSLQTIPALMLRHISDLNMKMYGIYREVRETYLQVGFSNVIFNKDGSMCKVTSDDYDSRIRLNSIVRIDFGDRVVSGQCFQWDCARTGREATVVLKKPVVGGVVKKIFVNRKKEKLMRRVLLRDYISCLSSAGFKNNCYQDHLYCVKSFAMKREQEEIFKKKMQPSQRLNKLQNLSLLRSMFPISLIHGPPGTGKTRVMTAICKDAVRRGQGVICLCWTNVALRRLCEAILEVVSSNVVRIGISKEYKCWHQSECKSIQYVEAKDYECQVLCLTVSKYLSSLNHGVTVNKWSKDLAKQREVLLLDEVSQLWELESAMLVNQMGRYDRASLTGDRKQLPPHVVKEADADFPSMITWIQRLPRGYTIPVTQLRMQYRMMPSVGSVVSNSFYDGILQHHKVSDGGKHLFFHCITGSMKTKSFSSFCEEDTRRCIRIYKRYHESNPLLKIQVLTFYQAQRDHVKTMHRNINVCCVDSFQGQEADIVILMTSVRCARLSSFMVHMGRLCVATSRAKKDLHIVGDWRTMFNNDTWKNILNINGKLTFAKIYN